MALSVSVIIPAWNEQGRVGDAIASAWRAGADEVLVVDGGSRDGTVREAAQEGAKVLEAQAGRGPQQNKGAAHATGDIFLFLHADCQLPEDGVRQVLAAVEGTGVLYGGFRQRILAEGRVYRWIETGNTLRARWMRWVYGDQGLFVRRDVFFQVGGFPEVPFLEDLILSRRLARLGPPALLPGPLRVDPRRWRATGPVRQTLLNWVIIAAYLGGASPERLARWYRGHEVRGGRRDG